ncbi:GNAT family N-acetyltransferase [Dolichospermum planctonicum CS-1226]|uniref:GNAT family N-acetyltransferase n=1 Tax=Dolichospermum planctonicum CS-1226 TaxID=3021751 RepID=A0ABT5AG36_9CYAN|nr:GNAT family N-acetyltransferase [Dolichospermum planctonicum]MDB9536268.1 GNAT family N-acetyltransferase [Dolichospermum planctonicum CS-1226]
MKIKIIDLADPLWLETLIKLRHDIYHLPEYLLLEANRIQAVPEAIIISDHDKIFFMVYLLRPCDVDINRESTIGEIFDIISPYGYSGILLSQTAMESVDFVNSAMQQLKEVLRSRKICSAFLRLHPILNQELNDIFTSEICQISGKTVAINLKLTGEEIWQQTKPEHRNKINRCKRRGFQAKIVDFKNNIDNFMAIYQETMDRVGASKHYYFDDNYFHQLSLLEQLIHLCIVEQDNQIACAGLFTECSGIVQYHLGGTKSDFLKEAPSKLMFDYVRFWAKERGNEVLHLGGGVGSVQDNLYRFKAGFSQQRYTFSTMRLITDEDNYYHLVNLQAKYLNIYPERLLKSEFFPAYRASH